MRYGVAISAALHVVIMILAIVGLPSLLNPDRETAVPVEIEMISEADMAKQSAPKPEPPKPEPPKTAEPPKPPPPPPTPAPQAMRLPEPEPIPVARPAPPEPPKPAAKPPPPEPIPDPAPKPKAKPKPPPEPEPVQEAKKAPAAPPAPRPKRKPAPPPDQFDSLLRNLAKEKRKQDKVKDAAPAPQAAATPAPQPRRSALQERMIAQSLSQSVIRQVSPCWSIPAGARDAANMSVAIRIRLNPDGALGAQPRIEDTGRLGSDPFFRAVAESALRALRNPQCMPLKLPYDQYDVWKDITFVFDPREALGQ